MLRFIVAGLVGISLTGSVYMAGWAPQTVQADQPECCVVATPLAAIDLPAGVTDMKNTKCIVEIDDVDDNKGFVVYQNKAYRICCGDCLKEFNKDPEKYVKAFDADPAKFGVSK